jgi:hypothetical protein
MSGRDNTSARIRQLEERITSLERQNKRLERAFADLLHHYISEQSEQITLDSPDLDTLRELEMVCDSETPLGKTVRSVVNTGPSRSLKNSDNQPHDETPTGKSVREENSEDPATDRSPTDDGYQI